ncbi:MAG: 30S ribosomal protein S9 [Candidatus Liptonbacteria bacterium]|nr:30S ribosomal protein S9 [Candidatus Liptonbacteria bacterium]
MAETKTKKIIAKAEPVKIAHYVEAVGRRKTAVARVRLTKGKGEVTVNGRALEAYFPLPRWRSFLLAPLERLKMRDAVNVSAKVQGGGPSGQAEAVRHGIARAIVLQSPEMKVQLRAFGFLTRDPRMVERKKYGLKKARRAPQWAKR